MKTRYSTPNGCIAGNRFSMHNAAGWFKSLVLLCLLSFTLSVSGQNIGINSTGASPHASAILDVDAAPSNNKGLLVPRIPLSAINVAAPVASPATSLLVYNTASAGTGSLAVVPGFYYWDGAKWVRLQITSGSSQDWSLTGNAGTNPSTNFLGTTDNQDMVVRTNNVEKMRVTASGNVGVGTNSPANKLEVFGGWNNNIMENGFSGYASAVYSSLSVLHASHFIGAKARGTYLAPLHPQNGDVLATFQGRNAISGGYTGMSVEASENQSPAALGAKIRFHTVPNGATSLVDRMVIENSGKVGIGTGSPYAHLDVVSSSSVTADPILRLMRNTPGAVGFISFHSGASFGDWNMLTNSGDKSIIFSNDLDPSVDDNTGLLIAPWTGTVNPTGGSKGMKIMENGYVSINLPNPLYTLHVNGTTACSGNIWTSDARFKQHVRPLEMNCLDLIAKLNPVTYTWKEVKDRGMEGTQIGFIAQELETILPGTVVTADDAEKTKGVKYIELIPIYAKAIQELQQQMEDLRREVAYLKQQK